MRIYFLSSLAIIIMAVSLNPSNQWFILPAPLMLILILDPTVFKYVIRREILMFLAILVILPPLIIGEKSGEFLGIGFNLDILKMNQAMALRSILIILALKLLTCRISGRKITSWISRSGFDNLSKVFDLSREALPDIKKIMGRAWSENKNNRQKKPLKGIYHFVVHLLVHVVDHADETFKKSESQSEPVKRDD